MTDDKLARMFRAHANIKAKLAAQAKEAKDAAAPLKAGLVTIETAMLKMMNDIGTDQLKVTGLGIVLPVEKVMPNCKDWQALWTHVAETGNFDLVARRLSSKHVKEFMDTHDGNLPPGVTIFVERGVSVRRQN